MTWGENAREANLNSVSVDICGGPLRREVERNPPISIEEMYLKSDPHTPTVVGRYSRVR